MPPKSHNLRYLAERIGVPLPEGIDNFITTLNDVSVPTRYPDDLRKLISAYSQERTKQIITQSRETLTWIKARQ